MKASLAVPAFNEEDTIPIFFHSVLSELPNDVVAGSSKSNGYKLFNLFLDGLTTLSILKTRMWEDIGLVFTVLTLIYGTRMSISIIALNDDVRPYKHVNFYFLLY